MKFAFAKIAAGVAMVVAAGGAHATLLKYIPLSIENDAVTTYGFNPANSTTEWYVSSNGPLTDSYFTMGGSKTRQALDTQYAYINSTANVLDLNGSIESTLGTVTNYGRLHGGAIKLDGFTTHVDQAGEVSSEVRRLLEARGELEHFLRFPSPARETP